MILLTKDGSRWSVNWNPSIVDIMFDLLQKTDEEIYTISSKVAKLRKFPLFAPSLEMLIGDEGKNFPITDYMRQRGVEIKNPFDKIPNGGDQS